MVKVKEIYLVHHTHTDIGYTHDQPVLWDLQRRFINTGIELARRDLEKNGPETFKWTVEATAPLLHWLQTATTEDIEQLKELESAGRIEVTGMWANITPLYGPAQTIESLRPIQFLRDKFNFDIEYGMNNDVNGQNWPLVDALLDAGIKGFSMGVNEHFGGVPFERPKVFLWEAPSGRYLPTFNGYHYSTGLQLGIGRDIEEFREKGWPLLKKRLDKVNFPLPALLIQSYHPFGDNGPAYGELTNFIENWNKQQDVRFGNLPSIRMATPADWWSVVEDYVEDLPVYKGDWTDFWNFGSISSARELAINRENRRRLLTADSLEAALVALEHDHTKGSSIDCSIPGTRDKAWWDLHFFDEHTWGADVAVSDPNNEDTYSQWNHKAHYAYEARGLSQLLRRDGIAELSRRINFKADNKQGVAGDDNKVLLFNPLPWQRNVFGPLPEHIVEPRGTTDDKTAGRHFQDRNAKQNELPTRAKGIGNNSSLEWTKPSTSLIPPTEVPGYGYKLVSEEELIKPTEPSFDDRATVETERYSITFDLEVGGISRWYDKSLDHEWVDEAAGFPLAGFIHEQVADKRGSPRQKLFNFGEADSEEWHASAAGIVDSERGFQPDWDATRTGPEKLLRHRVYETPLGYTVSQHLEVPEFESFVKVEILLPKINDRVIVEASWTMGLETRPEATYLAFPFNLERPSAHLDVGGKGVKPGEDQLENSVHDYFSVQRWVDISGTNCGMTIGTPINPLVQFDDFHFADNQSAFSLDRALFLGWITNNYWDTNFRAHQPGQVRARYHLSPHRGPFRESYAHRVGMEAEHKTPLAQTLSEEQVSNPSLSPDSSLLDLPEPPILVLQIRPAQEYSGIPDSGFGKQASYIGVDSLIILLRNSDKNTSTASINSSALTIQAANRVNPLGNETLERLAVKDGKVQLDFPSQELVAIKLKTTVER